MCFVAAGIVDRRFHDLPGTAVTLLANAGAMPQPLVGPTGHAIKSVDTIVQRDMALTPAFSTAAIMA